MRPQLIVFLVSLVLLATPLVAQTPADDLVSVNVLSNRIGIGEIGQLFIKVRNTEATMPERIAAQGLDIDFSGSQAAITIVNGRQTREVTYFYRFRGNEPGTFTIPEFEIRLDNGTAKTKPIVVTIVENNSSDAQLDATKPYFGKLELVRDSFYVNELVPFTLTAYVRGRNSISDVVAAEFKHESFVFKGFREVRTDGAEVENSYYSSAVIPSHLFALKPGSYRVGPATIAVRVLDSDGGFGLSSLFQRTVTRELVTNTLNLEVKPLPNGAPTSFTGGVGSFELTGKPSLTSFGVGDPVTMEFEVTGTGNLRTMSAPVFAIPQKGLWKSYEASKDLKDEEDSDGFQAGKVRFTQVIIPEARTEAIPEFQLSYFDPNKEAYVTLKAGPFPVTITQDHPAGSPASAPQAGSATPLPLPEAKRPEASYSDVLHIRTDTPHWISALPPYPLGRVFYIVQGLFSIVFFTILGVGFAGRFKAWRQSRNRSPYEIPFAKARKQLPKAGAPRGQFYHALAIALESWKREHPGAPSETLELLTQASERCGTVLYSDQDDPTLPISASEVAEIRALLQRLVQH